MQAQIGMIRDLFKAQWVRELPYDWVGNKLRNGKKEVYVTSRNINYGK